MSNCLIYSLERSKGRLEFFSVTSKGKRDTVRYFGGSTFVVRARYVSRHKILDNPVPNHAIKLIRLLYER